MARRWKKSSFRKLSAQHLRSLAEIDTESVFVACTKVITSEEADKYEHLGLSSDLSTWVQRQPVLPDRTNGRYSDRNIEGWEIIRKDLPKTTKSWTTEHVNFGDASKYGYHYQDHSREVYQRDFFEGPHHTIEVSAHKNDDGVEPEWTAIFKITTAFLRGSDTFESDLLFAVNLLQENVGASQIYPSDVTAETLLQNNSISWEIFPEGTAEDIIRSFSSRNKEIAPETAEVLRERVEFFNRLNPQKLIVGAGGFGGYFGAIYNENTLVFENLRYGNAIYILFDDWQEVSKRSRYDLLKGTDDNYHRIIHSDGWQRRLYLFLNERLNGRQPRWRRVPRLL